jgi:RND family efflux transporter MFP subunit
VASTHVVIPFVFSLLAVTACNRKISARTQDVAPAVTVATVERADLAHDMQFAAEFRPYQEVDLHAKVGGYLRNITVDVGDRVQAGQLLATLEAPEWTEQLTQASAVEKRTELDVVRARAEVTRAEAARQLRRVAFDRLSGVAQTRPNLIAHAEIEDAQARLHEADAQVAASKAALASMEQQVRVAGAGRGQVDTMMRYLRITAPFSGMVTKRYADPGAMVPAGTSSSALPVVRLSQVDRLRLVLPVPESVVPRVRVGAPVEVRVDSLKRVFQGNVSRMTGRLESSTRTMQTEVDVANREGVLKPGMYAYANITLDRRSETLALPVQAVMGAVGKETESVLRTVFVVGPQGRLEAREIRLGLDTPERVEVLDGLSEGDRVVVSASGLKVGQQVTPHPFR